MNFTAVLLVHCVLCFVLPLDLHLRRVTYALSLFVNVSFHSCVLMDPTCFARMRTKERWCLTTFHVGNLVLHLLPSVYFWSSYGVYVASQATATFVAWALWTSKGTFCYDANYVQMPRKVWWTAQALGFGCLWGVALWNDLAW